MINASDAHVLVLPLSHQSVEARTTLATFAFEEEHRVALLRIPRSSADLCSKAPDYELVVEQGSRAFFRNSV